MNPQGYLQHLTERFKTYSHLKLLLTSCTTKSEFNDVAKQVIDNINEDGINHFEFSKTVQSIPPVIEHRYMDLCDYSRKLMEYLCYYKNIMKEFWSV